MALTLQLRSRGWFNVSRPAECIYFSESPSTRLPFPTGGSDLKEKKDHYSAKDQD